MIFRPVIFPLEKIKDYSDKINDRARLSNLHTEKYQVLSYLIPAVESNFLTGSLRGELEKIVASEKLSVNWDDFSVPTTKYEKRPGSVYCFVPLADDPERVIGLVDINFPGPLKPALVPDSIDIDDDTVCDIRNNQDHGVSDQLTIDGKSFLVLQGWSFYLETALLGYSREKILDGFDCTDTAFDDGVFICDQCGEADWNDNGYHYNYRIVDYAQLGTKCGCYDEFCRNEYTSFANDHTQALDREAAEKLEGDDKIEKLETFVAGMTDSGRNHYFDGELVDVKTPEQALKEYKTEPRYKNDDFIFVIEESGQFQTYFSIYRLTGR